MNIPHGVTIIKANAFDYYTTKNLSPKIKEVYIPSSVYEIGKYCGNS